MAIYDGAEKTYNMRMYVVEHAVAYMHDFDTLRLYVMWFRTSGR